MFNVVANTIWRLVASIAVGSWAHKIFDIFADVSSGFLTSLPQ